MDDHGYLLATFVQLAIYLWQKGPVKTAPHKAALWNPPTARLPKTEWIHFATV